MLQFGVERIVALVAPEVAQTPEVGEGETAVRATAGRFDCLGGLQSLARFKQPGQEIVERDRGLDHEAELSLSLSTFVAQVSLRLNPVDHLTDMHRGRALPTLFTQHGGSLPS